MIGDRLKEARVDCGLTQQQVADLLGIDRSSYTYYETGKCKVSTQTLKLLAVIFGIEFESLLYEEPKRLEFHSETKYKPFSQQDVPLVSGFMSPEERKLLAQLRMICYLGKEEELNRMLDSLIAPEIADSGKTAENNTGPEANDE